MKYENLLSFSNSKETAVPTVPICMESGPLFREGRDEAKLVERALQ
jgi:hypothetical protein